jgi:hypothetical protein
MHTGKAIAMETLEGRSFFSASPTSLDLSDASIEVPGRDVAAIGMDLEIARDQLVRRGLAASEPTSEPSISVRDVKVNEGNAGTAFALFEVTMSEARSFPVTVNFKTVDGTASARGGDYVRQRGQVTFSPGSLSQLVAVVIRGDRTVEPDETFHLVLSRPTVGAFAKGAATCTIVNDDLAAL